MLISSKKTAPRLATSSLVFMLLYVQVRFEWDEAKNRQNRRKHGVDFEVAALVFGDPNHRSEQDRFVNGEERWQTIGLVNELFAGLPYVDRGRNCSDRLG